MIKTLIIKNIYIVLLLIMIVIPFKVSSQNDSLKISILTVSKGSEVYSLFGHTAIRVRNINQRTDLVYNFGLFDFDTPAFFIKFLSGKLPYMLGTHQYFDFLKINGSQKRGIWEQHLNLKHENKVKIISKLQSLLNSDDKYYKYEFFDRNCTSQIRDIVFENAGISDSLSQITDTLTYRAMLNKYLHNRYWYKLGINLIVGTYVDKKLSKIEAMALPEMFMNGLDKININDKPIVYKHNTIIKENESISLFDYLISPLAVFTLLIILFWITKSLWITYFTIIISSLGGMFLMFLWLITEHIDLQNNWDILFINPLYLLLFLNHKKYKNLILSVVLVLLLSLLLRAFIFLIGIQELILEFIPIIILNVMILVMIGKKLKVHQA